MSLFDLALYAGALVIFTALYGALRRPERRRRYLFVAILIVSGLLVGVWVLAQALCCY